MSGAIKDGVQSFKGIPFAAPPVGPLRWRPPQPAIPWTGMKAATEYGHDCMQKPFPSDAAPLGTAPAEDCLVLPDAVTPAEAAAAFVNPITVLAMIETMRLEGHTGLGDVRVWPSASAGILEIELSSPFGHAHFEVPSGEVAGFLDRTYRLVPAGAEGDHVDVEAELADLLRQA